MSLWNPQGQNMEGKRAPEEEAPEEIMGTKRSSRRDNTSQGSHRSYARPTHDSLKLQESYLVIPPAEYGMWLTYLGSDSWHWCFDMVVTFHCLFLWHRWWSRLEVTVKGNGFWVGNVSPEKFSSWNLSKVFTDQRRSSQATICCSTRPRGKRNSIIRIPVQTFLHQNIFACLFVRLTEDGGSWTANVNPFIIVIAPISQGFPYKYKAKYNTKIVSPTSPSTCKVI